ncbi:MAG: hypothetical protein KAS32_22695 [Candidatus Peribacteraceae bacterium]|nr:hypothetical protein [Candidatus Peribacteraceae bacterium]
MKIKGKKLEGPNIIPIIIPRATREEDIIFMAKAVLNYDVFDKMVDLPKPPTMMHAGETKHSPLLSDPEYLERLKKYNRIRLAWMVITSLEATEELEWETMNKDNPETWLCYEDELEQSGLSDIERGRILRGCMEANSLDQTKIDEAKMHFLAMRREEAEAQNSQEEEAQTMPSGVPANGSGLDLTG